MLILKRKKNSVNKLINRLFFNITEGLAFFKCAIGENIDGLIIRFSTVWVACHDKHCSKQVFV